MDTHTCTRGLPPAHKMVIVGKTGDFPKKYSNFTAAQKNVAVLFETFRWYMGPLYFFYDQRIDLYIWGKFEFFKFFLEFSKCVESQNVCQLKGVARLIEARCVGLLPRFR